MSSVMLAFTGNLAGREPCTDVTPMVLMKILGCDAVKQSDNPSAAEVDRVHGLLVESLSRMYAEHKHLVPGWENRPLHII